MLRSYLGFPRAVYVLCLGTFINRAGTFLLPFLTLYLVGERGLGIRFATVGMSAYGAGAIAGSLLGGHLADLIGRRAVMLISLLGGAAVLRFFGYITDPWSILAAVVVFTVLAEMYRPAASAMIADLVEPDRRPQAFGLMYVAVNLGFAIGALVGGWLATVWFTWLFWGDALTAAAYAVIILFCIRETMPSHPTGIAATAEPVPTLEGNALATVAPYRNASDTLPDAARAKSRRFEALSHMLGDRTFVVFCLGCILCGIVFFQAMSTFPLFLGRRGLGPDAYGSLISINGAMIVLCQLPVAAFISRFHRGTVVALAAVVLAVGFGATNLAQTWPQFAFVVVLWTCGELMQAPLMSSIVTDLAPARFRARYLGVFSMCFSSANMIGAPLGGAVLARWGGSHLWGGCFVVALIAAALFAGIRGRLLGPVGEVQAG
ncbi:MAG TPA: MFS transporter [Phycisphaerae bacterium]|nr:MFS transporter [Phycisphaerae bacterium]